MTDATTETLNWDAILAEGEKLQREMLELNQELEKKKALYKAFTKRHIGIADNEPTNVLDIAKAIRAVMAK